MEIIGMLLIPILILAITIKAIISHTKKKYGVVSTKNNYKAIQNKTMNIKMGTNTLLMIIAGAVVIIAVIMIRDKYEEYQAIQSLKKVMYGTTNDLEIEKKNNDMKREMIQIQQQTKEMIKKQNEVVAKMQREANEELEKFRN
jgi:IS1 family transposase